MSDHPSAVVECSEFPCLAVDRRNNLLFDLAAARAREGRLHAELIEQAQETLRRAWRHSVHHSWVENVVEFLQQDCALWQLYEIQGDRLRGLVRQLAREGHHLYASEEEQVLDLAKALTHYAAALKIVNGMERSRLEHAKAEVELHRA